MVQRYATPDAYVGSMSEFAFLMFAARKFPAGSTVVVGTNGNLGVFFPRSMA